MTDRATRSDARRRTHDAEPITARLIPDLISLILFAHLLTPAPSDNAGRAHAAYGRIYIAASLFCLWMAQEQALDRWDLIGGAIDGVRRGKNHSRSIVLSHRNALIFQRKFFLLTVKARLSGRQKISLMISKENSRASNSVTFQRLSTTIGRFFASSITQRIARQREKYRRRS